jgi:hypothetical protein
MTPGATPGRAAPAGGPIELGPPPSHQDRGGPQLIVTDIGVGHNIHHHSVWRFGNGKET